MEILRSVSFINFKHILWHLNFQEMKFFLYSLTSVSSVAQSCPTLCDPVNRSMPGLPVHHQLLELTQTHAHRVSDAIQPSHPRSSPSPPAPPSIRVFSNESTLRIRWPKYWSFSFNISASNKYSGLIFWIFCCTSCILICCVFVYHKVYYNFL